METIRKTSDGKTQRKMDGVRRSTTKNEQPEEDTRDRNGWRNLVLGERRPPYSGQSLVNRRNEQTPFLGTGYNGTVPASLYFSANFLDIERQRAPQIREQAVNESRHFNHTTLRAGRMQNDCRETAWIRDTSKTGQEMLL